MYTTLIYVGFLPLNKCFGCACLCACVDSLGASGLFKFVLSYAKAMRRHLCQLDVVFVVIVD